MLEQIQTHTLFFHIHFISHIDSITLYDKYRPYIYEHDLNVLNTLHFISLLVFFFWFIVVIIFIVMFFFPEEKKNRITKYTQENKKSNTERCVYLIKINI